MELLDVMDRIAHGRSKPPASFTIASERILDEPGEGEEQFLKPQASYFEIRLKQMYLRNQRDYWRTFRPITPVVSAFLHGGSRREVPFVVGPEMLGEGVQVEDGDQIEYLNTRVAGPIPYEGDDLRLFVGLARVQVNDWSVQALGLLETFAKAFDPSKLSLMLNVAEPLAAGLRGFFGMKDVELRMGLSRDYMQPRGRGGVRPDTLQRRYEVLLNVPDQDLDRTTRETKFWVKEGRLFYGAQEDNIQPYRDADFLLYQIQPLSERADYTTFDFHKVYWQDTIKTLWDGNEEGARQKLRLLAANLAVCPDIVRPQRNILLGMYKQQFEEEIEIHQNMFSGIRGVSGTSEASRSNIQARAEAVTEREMTQAIRESRASGAFRQLQELSPEAVLSELGL